ncbi:hypothetical protein KSP39_PZI007156 [Platanthera zijinensis]|uniref:Uncharacterized protein n=1 Tax=Platanthera zijinensis TaxID=2320716 RepID=A0AAP0GAF3_9ASPA
MAGCVQDLLGKISVRPPRLCALLIVAKCSYGRPPLSSLKGFFSSLFKLAGDFQIAHLNARHILLSFDKEQDFPKPLVLGEHFAESLDHEMVGNIASRANLCGYRGKFFCCY